MGLYGFSSLQKLFFESEISPRLPPGGLGFQGGNSKKNINLQRKYKDDNRRYT